jgi:hypothetical protein
MNGDDSPFSSTQTVPKQAGKSKKPWVFIGIGIISVIVISGLIKGIGRFTDDNYRTLDVFPSSDFLENHESLVGNRFRLNGTVDAELGTETGRGKLVSFRDDKSQKVIPVMIPSATLPGYPLGKDQRYKIEVEVTSGGMLYAKNLSKE